MLAKLLLLFTLVPVVELAILIAIGQRIGTLPTVAIILATGVAGAWLTRREGLRTWRAMRSSLASGSMPANPLLQAAAILGGGALLLTPGVLTDILGFALLIPPSRAALLRFARRRLERRLLDRTGGIEARFRTREPPPE